MSHSPPPQAPLSVAATERTRFIRRLVLTLAVAMAAGAAYIYLVSTDPEPGTAPALAGAPADMSPVQRGAYLAKAADCVACHTRPGGRPFAGGLAFKLPFGTIYSTNISPDRNSGIGAWSDEDFVRALHDGIRRDGQRLYPAFPYTSYSQLSRDDVLAIKAYLFSLPAIAETNKAVELSFPFNQRWAMGFWNAAFFKGARFESNPKRSAQWNTGAYLAGPLAHCAECHTPRNIGFALDHRQEFAGAQVGGWWAPNISADPRYGVGSWSNAALADYLVRGHADGHGSPGGPMAEAVSNSLQYLAPDDVRALLVYLRSVSPQRGDRRVEITPQAQPARDSNPITPTAATPATWQAGEKLFAGACASCHRWDGAGRQSSFAALNGSFAVNDPKGDNLVMMILEGIDTNIGGRHLFMPSFSSYTDAEIAALANYVIGHFGGGAGTVTPQQVAKHREH